jgi:hypothetical protein
VGLLDTGDVIDPLIGDRTFKTKSSEELAGLNVLVEWAKAARLLRVAGGRLLPVKKNAKLLERPLQLWTGLFEAIPRIGVALLPQGWAESFLSHEFGEGIEALLARLYAAEGAVPIDELCQVVWTRVTAPYLLDGEPEERRHNWRQANDRDAQRVLESLSDLGAVRRDRNTAELTPLGRHGMARLRGEPQPGDPIYEVRIDLEVKTPAVWRRLRIPATVPLYRLHLLIQAAMGWQNRHLHEFTIGGVHYGPASPDLGLDLVDERKAVLNQLAGEGERFTYTYDFGDSWDHAITVERVLAAEPGGRYPVCVAGSGACPPEDCGGEPGYADLMEILADPGHREHRGMLEWLGLRAAEDFDADRFDADQAHHRMAQIPAPR